MESNNENNQVVIDEGKLRKIECRVFLLEKENYKTKRFKDNEMIDKIIKLIAQEVDNAN